MTRGCTRSRGSRTSAAPTGSRSSATRADADALPGGDDLVARVELPTPSRLRLAVDRHLVRREHRLRLAAVAGDPGELEELTEPDRVAADGLVAHVAHATAAATVAMRGSGSWSGCRQGIRPPREPPLMRSWSLRRSRSKAWRVRWKA